MKTKSILKALDAEVKKLTTHQRRQTQATPKQPKKNMRRILPSPNEGKVVVA